MAGHYSNAYGVVDNKGYGEFWGDWIFVNYMVRTLKKFDEQEQELLKYS